MFDRSDARKAVLVSVPYLILASLWVAGTDALLARIGDPAWVAEAQTLKGIGFVVLSSVLLFLLLALWSARQRRSERTTAETRRQLERAQEIGRMGSWELDVAADEITWSDQIFRIFGLSREEFGGTYEAFFERVHPADQPAMQRAQDAALGGGGSLDHEHRIVRPDGEVRWVHERGRVIFDDAGRPVRFTGTVQDITELRRAQRRLERAAGRLERLSRRLLEVQEDERRALARELHDEVGQSLTLVHLSLERARAEEPSVEGLAEASRFIAAAMEQVRDLSLSLRPALLDDMGLVPALRWLVDRQGQASGVELRLHGGPGAVEPPEGVRIAAFRIVQEALTNALRHAEPDSVRIGLAVSAGHLCVEVEDDGCGLDVTAALDRAGSGASFGLVGMRERAELAGGSLELHSQPGGGTLVRARLPLAGPP